MLSSLSLLTIDTFILWLFFSKKNIGPEGRPGSILLLFCFERPPGPLLLCLELCRGLQEAVLIPTVGISTGCSVPTWLSWSLLWHGPSTGLDHMIGPKKREWNLCEKGYLYQNGAVDLFVSRFVRRIEPNVIIKWLGKNEIAPNTHHPNKDEVSQTHSKFVAVRLDFLSKTRDDLSKWYETWRRVLLFRAALY